MVVIAFANVFPLSHTCGVVLIVPPEEGTFERRLLSVAHGDLVGALARIALIRAGSCRLENCRRPVHRDRGLIRGLVRRHNPGPADDRRYANAAFPTTALAERKRPVA